MLLSELKNLKKSRPNHEQFVACRMDERKAENISGAEKVGSVPVTVILYSGRSVWESGEHVGSPSDFPKQ